MWEPNLGVTPSHSGSPAAALANIYKPLFNSYEGEKARI